VTWLVPDLVLDRDGVRRDVAVRIDGDAIGAVVTSAEAPAEALRLTSTALLPGFANAHSHAFQRDLRGIVERVDPSRPDDDFWTWREEMYAQAGRMDPERIHDVARRCYRQMRASGATAVGEFHYVHHQPDGTPYDRPNALAEAVCEAAEAEGLRIVLLLVAYERGGEGIPPTPGQRRFCDPTVEAYLERLDALRAWAEGRPLVTVGAAPHSMRAVSPAWLAAIGAHTREHGLPLHIHADEQPREIRESLEWYGRRPVQVIDDAGALHGRTVIVHGTHCDDDELDLLAARGAGVCVCPTTEANLGDGYAPIQRMFERGISVSVGSDSNTILDPLVEARELEAMARRTAGRRNVLVRPGDPGPAPYLLDVGWSAGARALGLPDPTIAVGAPADLIAVDLACDEIAGTDDEHLAAAIALAGSSRLVTRTWVGGA
jgi:formimidoylglutamate deiminase